MSETIVKKLGDNYTNEVIAVVSGLAVRVGGSVVLNPQVVGLHLIVD